jgi:multiple sugar transport system ATP-binding protein
MRDGLLQQVAPPHEIYDRPANRFVATFVGNPPMNIMKATVDALGIRVGGVTLALDAARKADCLAGAITEIGVRPEDLTLVDPGSAGAVTGEIYVVEPMGNETLVDVRVGGDRLNVRALRGFAAPVGSTIGVTFDPANASFFDAAGTTVVHRAPNKGGR